MDLKTKGGDSIGTTFSTLPGLGLEVVSLGSSRNPHQPVTLICIFFYLQKVDFLVFTKLQVIFYEINPLFISSIKLKCDNKNNVA